MAFDTLASYQQLIDVGMSEAHARAYVEVLLDVSRATRLSDLKTSQYLDTLLAAGVPEAHATGYVECIRDAGEKKYGADR